MRRGVTKLWPRAGMELLFEGRQGFDQDVAHDGEAARVYFVQSVLGGMPVRNFVVATPDDIHRRYLAAEKRLVIVFDRRLIRNEDVSVAEAFGGGPDQV